MKPIKDVINAKILKIIDAGEAQRMYARKRVYAWEQKTADQIYEILKQEQKNLEAAHPLYQFEDISKPVYGDAGELIYTFTFKKKQWKKTQ